MRETFLPFARPSLGEAEIAEVADTLRSGWITTGPKVEKFTEYFFSWLDSIPRPKGMPPTGPVGPIPAATTEQLGALGQGKGMAAAAVVLLRG